MSNMLDSEAVFEARLLAVGVEPENIRLLRAKKIKTMALLNFCSSAQPGDGDEKPFVNFIASALGTTLDEIDSGQLASIRRAWFEAHAVSIAEVRSLVTRTDSSEPVKMPLPEREQRFQEQQKRLVGVDITPVLEPSHQLVDFCSQLKLDGMLKYIDPAKCTSRDQETLGVKKQAFLRHNADGSIKVQETEDALVADMSGLYQVRLALQRRSLACDLVKLAPYGSMEKYHDRLFGLISSEVPDTHLKIGLQQILRADKLIFTKMIIKCRAGVSQRADGIFPLVEALADSWNDPIVVAALQPLPKPVDKVEKNVNRWEPYQSSKGGKGGKSGKSGKSGKGGKGGGTQPPPSLPKELEGLRTRTRNGDNICWDVNLEKGCNFAKWGQKCKRGMHICMKCGGHHAATAGKCQSSK